MILLLFSDWWIEWLWVWKAVCCLFGWFCQPKQNMGRSSALHPSTLFCLSCTDQSMSKSGKMWICQSNSDLIEWRQVRPVRAKVLAFGQFRPPSTKKKLMCLIGMAGYCHRAFCRKFSSVMGATHQPSVLKGKVWVVTAVSECIGKRLGLDLACFGCPQNGRVL